MLIQPTVCHCLSNMSETPWQHFAKFAKWPDAVGVEGPHRYRSGLPAQLAARGAAQVHQKYDASQNVGAAQPFCKPAAQPVLPQPASSAISRLNQLQIFMFSSVPSGPRRTESNRLEKRRIFWVNHVID